MLIYIWNQWYFCFNLVWSSAVIVNFLLPELSNNHYHIYLRWPAANKRRVKKAWKMVLKDQSILVQFFTDTVWPLKDTDGTCWPSVIENWGKKQQCTTKQNHVPLKRRRRCWNWDSALKIKWTYVFFEMCFISEATMQF